MYIKRKEYTKGDFNWTDWSASDIKKLVPEILASKKDSYEKVKKILKGKRTFENTIYALEASDYDISPKTSAISLLMNTSPKKDVREVAKNAIDILQKEMIDIEYDEDIYKAVKEYSGKSEKLEGEEKKMLKDMLLGYKRMGFELTKDKRNELKENKKVLAELSVQFEKNINDYKDSVVVSKD